MKTFRAIATVAALSVASAAPAMPAGPKVTTKAPKVSAQAPKASAPAPKVSAKAPKSDRSASKAIDAPKSGKAIGASKKSSDAAASMAPAATTTTTPAVVEPNALSTKISAKPDQLARITAMLPQGMTLEQATAGFRNQGQFVAALNASKNNGVKFVDLQKAMTVDGLSLGQAVKQLKAAPAPAPTTPTTTTTAPGGSGGTSL
jgi:hypothetical protein